MTLAQSETAQKKKKAGKICEINFTESPRIQFILDTLWYYILPPILVFQGSFPFIFSNQNIAHVLSLSCVLHAPPLI
jgi:hypothetical protein